MGEDEGWGSCAVGCFVSCAHVEGDSPFALVFLVLLIGHGCCLCCCRMVQEGNITAQDAMRHAEALNSVRVRKKGDAQRILLMNMVKVRARVRALCVCV